MIQQYDLNPQSQPTMVANVSHAPVNAPPTPPDSIPRETPPPIEPPTVPMSFETCSSEEEGQQLMSPLQKIAQEMDQMEEERRDRVTPLSPVSSRASSRNSLSSASSYGRRGKSRNRDKNYSSKASDNDSESTFFSSAASSLNTGGRESMSIRSTSSNFSSKYQPSSLRQEMLRSPEEAKSSGAMDLFPYVKARLSEVKFRTPHYGTTKITPDVLRREMLSVIFGWDHDIEALIRDEQSRHKRGSASCVLLAKWLGDNGADTLAQMVGSESMTSSDWMLLALSCQMGQGSQKQIGEAFVRRLLETDEVHPAVAILLGLGQQNDAVEAYVSRKYYMEAVLLTCLLFPNDWQRQSYLVRKWAETVVAKGQPELAVRCFSCTSIESSEAWFSPRAQDEVYAAQQTQFSSMSPPTSPPSAGNPNRKTAKNASLKLITDFGSAPPKAQINTATGVTPIVDSALSPGGAMPYKRSGSRGLRDPSSARTATPSGYGRKRAGSSDVGSRHNQDSDMTPHANNNSRAPTRPGSRASNADPGTAINSRKAAVETLPSPAHHVFAAVREASRPRETSRERNPHGLQIQMANVKETEIAESPYPASNSTRSRHNKSRGSLASDSRDDMSPLLTDGTSQSYKGRSIDRYINSLEEANFHADKLRAQNRSRGESRERSSRSRPRQQDSSEGLDEVTYIRPSKRSPSSPVPMTSDDASRYTSREKGDRANTSDIASPVESRTERPRARSRTGTSRTRGSSRNAQRAESPERRHDGRSDSRTAAARASSKGRTRAVSPQSSHAKDDRGRSHGRKASGARSPSSPSPMAAFEPTRDDSALGEHPSSRRTNDTGRRTVSPERSTRARSSSRRMKEPSSATTEPPNHALQLLTRSRDLSRKELAAKELEERRLSLARRPSVPAIPHPGELSSSRSNLSPRSATEGGPTFSSSNFFGDIGREQRSRTVDPENIRHSVKINMGSSPSSTTLPTLGLPATPRAMRHPRYMGSEPDANDAIPAVPALPANLQAESPSDSRNVVPLATLLPSSVYTQTGIPRSASAPPEHTSLPVSRNRTNSRGHSRRPSEMVIGAAPEDHQQQIVIIEESDESQPPVLPELQHLATPPPPPPPPVPSGPMNVGGYFPPGASVTTSSSGVINISIDNGNSTNPMSSSPRNNSRTTTPAAEHAPSSIASATAPSHARRGRGSISGPSMSMSASSASASNEKVPETFGSKWNKVKDRMRSDSRNRTKSPQQSHGVENFAPSPYETVLPSKSWGVSSPGGGQSQGGKGEQMQMQMQMPPPPPPMPAVPGMGMSERERASPPRVTMHGGYRNPKEIKEMLQGGAYQRGVDGGMI